MSPVRFDRFRLDLQDRRLTRDGQTVELSGRYLDALALLVAERGRLVTKDRFMAEVWKGVPVTDEALTQCVRSLRRVLGDDAGRPRFIETVPKHGYRFVAEVADGQTPAVAKAAATPPVPPKTRPAWREGLSGAASGGAGGAVAGLIGGMVYGLAVSPEGMGAASALLVLVCATTLLALAAGGAVGFGVETGRVVRSGLWGVVLGGAFAGALIGGVTRLVALDALAMLTGRAPADMTGAAEGLAIGAAIGLGVWTAARRGWSARRSALASAALGLGVGGALAALGGRLLGGSLNLLLQAYPDARLDLSPIGAVVGESGFGPVARTITASLEAGLFVGCVTAFLVARPALRQAPVGEVAGSGVRG
ncbi:MAG TPA: transcriptional regulator [Brevundimonas sp.]|jgi:DNA-binding winged helix-turn-helix (wHTH) protein|uniref:winged helix-turn-helix domain-containing protein n=1 Tax=Brevundimonas sp. TaxID=1871086 RepID=UPI002DF3855F|nr:transcriptional regulator [Brevundimonas sp.]